MPSPLLTAGDVAELCQVSAKTVMRAIRSGDLRAARLGKRGAFRIAPEDVDAWLDSNSITPSHAAADFRAASSSKGRVSGHGRLVITDDMRGR